MRSFYNQLQSYSILIEYLEQNACLNLVHTTHISCGNILVPFRISHLFVMQFKIHYKIKQSSKVWRGINGEAMKIERLERRKMIIEYVHTNVPCMHTTTSRDEWVCDKQFWCMPVYLRKSIAHSSIRVNGEDLEKSSIVLKFLLRNHWQVDEKVGASAVCCFPHFGLVNFITYWDWLSPAYSVGIASASDCSLDFKMKITSEECVEHRTA